MKIFLAADHAGFDLKKKAKQILSERGHAVEDCGALTLDADDDYPDFMSKVAVCVSKNPEARGIIFGGSGQGEAMVANRVKGVRAAVLYAFDENIIKLSREHNDANVLSIGTRFVNESDALRAIELWLNSPFPGDDGISGD